MADQYSVTAGGTPEAGTGINHTRRMYNFGERVAELAPEQTPFFVYLSKVAKASTDDPVFKFLEQRHQWQRRNFDAKGATSSASYTKGTEVANMMKVDVTYDKYGRVVTTPVRPEFLLDGQVIMIPDTAGTLRHFLISQAPDLTADSSAAAQIDLTPLFTATCAFADNAKCQVVGSAFAEGGTDPAGWKDELYDREGYCQIFKTAIPLFSGTTLATRYRGRPDEYKRVWSEKLMEHKMDVEHAMLFGSGGADESATAGPQRYTWGILPYTETYGKVKNFTYASRDYDAFVDAMEDIFAPESGNSGQKLVLASRKIIAWFQKLGSASFLHNTVELGQVSAGSPSDAYGGNGYRLDVQNVKGAFGHNMMRINTVFGDLHFVQEPLLRGATENYAVMVDMKNVKYRPLAANGVSRDTHIITNVQNNNVDGRKDIIMTEAGLEISLPETHAILKWA